MSPKRLLAHGLKSRRPVTWRAHSTEHMQSFQGEATEIPKKIRIDLFEGEPTICSTAQDLRTAMAEAMRSCNLAE